jgi:hypothetical protein
MNVRKLSVAVALSIMLVSLCACADKNKEITVKNDSEYGGYELIAPGSTETPIEIEDSALEIESSTVEEESSTVEIEDSSLDEDDMPVISSSDVKDDSTVCWQDGEFTLDGKVVRLPILYSDLVELGWSLKESDPENIMSAGDYTTDAYEVVNEAYPDVVGKVMFCNFTDEDHVLEECSVWVISLSCGTFDGDYDAYPDVDIGDIQFGASYQEVSSLFGEADSVSEKEYATSYQYNLVDTSVGFSISSEDRVTRMQLAHIALS